LAQKKVPMFVGIHYFVRGRSLEEGHLAKRIPFRSRFTGHEMRPVPDRIAELPKPFEGGVFDDGLVQAHGFGGLSFFGFGSFFKSFVA